MKRNIFYTVIAFLLSISLYAQNSGFKYQAILRNSEGNPLVNTEVNYIFMITEGDSEIEIYNEEQILTTNEFGLIVTTVGEGTPVTGNFSEIDWSADSHSLVIEINLNDGNGYQLLGTSPIMAVPYALHAQTAETVMNDQVEDADADAMNEIQDLQLNGNILTITNNGMATEIDLSVFLDDTDTHLTEAEVDAMTDNNGYLTGHLTENEVDAMVDNNGYLTDFLELDGDVTNEIQDLSLNGNILTITNNGMATDIDLSIYLDDTNTQLTETEVDEMVANNGYLTEFTELDGDASNEIQSISISGNTLSISDGNSVEIPSGDNDWNISNSKLISNKDTVVVGTSYNNASLQVSQYIDANIHLGGNPNRDADINFDYFSNTLSLEAQGSAPNIKCIVNDSAVLGVYASHKVAVNGTFRLQDGTQANGRVLTSDYDGNASWQDIPVQEQKYYSVDRMSFGDGATLENVDGTYIKLKDVGTFTKVNEDTEVEIDFFGLLSVVNLVGVYVDFQIRVDDNYTSSNGFGRIPFMAHQADGNKYYEQINSVWPFLTAGDHTISIWVRTSFAGSADQVNVNLGNYGAYFVIREYTND